MIDQTEKVRASTEVRTFFLYIPDIREFVPEIAQITGVYDICGMHEIIKTIYELQKGKIQFVQSYRHPPFSTY